MQDPNTKEIRVSQDHYVKELKSVPVPTEKKDEELCTETEQSAYQSLLGGIGWLVNTRMDVAVYIAALQRATKSPTIGHLKKLNQVLK